MTPNGRHKSIFFIFSFISFLCIIMLLGIGAHGSRFEEKKHVLLSLEVPLQLTQKTVA